MVGQVCLDAFYKCLCASIPSLIVGQSSPLPVRLLYCYLNIIAMSPPGE